MRKEERPALFLDAGCLSLASDGAQAITAANARGFVFLLTRTPIDTAQLADLARAEAAIDAVYVASPGYDTPPRPGMLMRALAEFPVARERSLLIATDANLIAAANELKLPAFAFTGGDLKPFADWAWADIDGGR